MLKRQKVREGVMCCLVAESVMRCLSSMQEPPFGAPPPHNFPPLHFFSFIMVWVWGEGVDGIKGYGVGNHPAWYFIIQPFV